MERSWRMREFSNQRKKVIALCGCLSSMNLLVLATGHHPRWVAFAGLGVGAVLLVYIVHQFVVLKSQE
jgi:intracellular septation protein A